jgi:hypothetical protein
VTHDGKIAKIPCRRRGHKSLVPALTTPRIRPGRKLKSQDPISQRIAVSAKRLMPVQLGRCDFISYSNISHSSQREVLLLDDIYICCEC